jgi:uncharacterized alkaline shock family protein YloU
MTGLQETRRPVDVTKVGPTVDPAMRGRTTIATRVVEKVAAQAAIEVDAATGPPRRLFGSILGPPRADARARASAKIDETRVTLSMSIGVQYPEPVREVAARVRRNVNARIAQYCGMQVLHTDVTVPALVVERPPPRAKRVI